MYAISKEAFNKEVSDLLNFLKYISFNYLVFRTVALDYFLLWALLYMEILDNFAFQITCIR